MMKTLAVMIATMTLAAGCVIHTTDRDHGNGGNGSGSADVATISATWALRNMSDGATTKCPAGFDTMQLIAQAVDASGNATADPNSDLFDCEARRGVSTDLPPDVYQVWLEVRSRDLTQLYAQSLSQVLDVRQADASFDADVLNDGGFFQIAWDLVDKTNQRPVSCAQGGAGMIHAVSTSVTDAHRIYDDLRACDDHASVTDGLLEGSYTVTIGAVAGSGAVGAPITLRDRKIGDRNQVTDLGRILIPVDHPLP